jgi:CBS domain-containing protein
MRLADVLDSCAVKTVTVGPEVSLAEAARAMHEADAAVAIVLENGGLQGVVTAGDILRGLTSATSPTLAWVGRVTSALPGEPQAVTAEERVGRVIAKMTAAGIDYLPVITKSATFVVALCNLLRAENAYLHGEVRHLQTYIDALHDAPND